MKSTEENTTKTSLSTEAEKTSEKPSPSIMQKSDPEADDTIHVLMIGNSGCYYYTDELYEMARAAGIKMRVCNVYYSGCSLKQHWSWWRTDKKNYSLFTVDEKGRTKKEKMGLNDCLKLYNWDAISIQQAFSPNLASVLNSARSSCEPYMYQLIPYLREQFPMSDLYWHQTWTYQVGYGMKENKNGTIEDTQKQTLCHNNIRTVSLELCETYQLSRIPVGDAWQLARAGARIGDVLCARNGEVSDFSDYLHDGDTGGGQYLNACVWLECITGTSPIGNSFRPSYKLNEDRILALQELAHAAVQNM
jgi:hypothetical protein